MNRAKSLNVIILLQSTLHHLPKKRVISFGDKVLIRDHNCAQRIPRAEIRSKSQIKRNQRYFSLLSFAKV